MVMMVMDVVMVMMMVHHRPRARRLVIDRSGASGRTGGCFLRDGISGEAEGENGRDHKALDHRNCPGLNAPNYFPETCLNLG